MSDQIVDRIRAAAEELTGVPAVEQVPGSNDGDRSGARRSVLIATAACVGLLMVGLVVMTNNRSDEPATSAGPPLSSMTVQDSVGQWLDLPGPPTGLRQEVNLSLASTTVCTTTVVAEEALFCTGLEGQIESHYLPVDAVANADETENVIEIRTRYIDLDLPTFIENFSLESASPVAVRDTEGYLITGDVSTTVVWSDRPGTISTLATKPGSGLDPIALADQLVGQPWPASLHPPIVAVDFDDTWQAYDNNHPYALATTRPGAECISIGYIPSDPTDPAAGDPEQLTCTTPDEQAWTIGTISDHTSPLDDHDVFAGLVPATVARVEMTLDDGRNLTADTREVPGLTTRSWGVPTGAPQGTIAVGQIAGFTAGGDEVFSEPLVALVPTVMVDSVCFQPGTTGIVPDVVGQDLRTANDTLHTAGVLNALKYTGDQLPIVEAQTPAAGTDVECGDVILSFAN